MKSLKCSNQMLRCAHTGGGLYWYCPRCNNKVESTGISEEEEKYGDSYGEKFRKYEDIIERMKCCGNCEKYFADCEMKSKAEEKYLEANACCKHWKLKEERINEYN